MPALRFSAGPSRRPIPNRKPRGRASTDEPQQVRPTQAKRVEVANRVIRQTVESLEDRPPSTRWVPAKKQAVEELCPADLSLMVSRESIEFQSEERVRRSRRHELGEANRDGKGVSGARMEPAALVACSEGARRLRSKAARPRHRQHSVLFPLDLGDTPAIPFNVGVDCAPYALAIQCSRFVKIRVFNEQRALVHREHVEEPEALGLIDVCIHQDGSLQLVRFLEPHLEAYELLVSAWR